MCVTIVMDDRDLTSPGDLKLQGWDIRDSDYYDPDDHADDDGACLCGFDVYAVLIRNGIPYEEDIPGFIYVQEDTP
jgi:hypothetical protein